MQIFYDNAHLAHAPREEFEQGQLLPAVEIPERVEQVRARIEARKIGAILSPHAFGNEPILRVHDAAFVQFLTDAYGDWRSAYPNDTADAYPSVWPARGLRMRKDGDIESKLGSYAFDTASPITKGTWSASRAGVNVALSAAQAIQDGARSAFALSRPPGHHASADVFGGYCYLNNVAIAAQWLCDRGLRPAILDVDYHHGNGTQDIFYSRNDVFFCSLHADPTFAYPHFLGFADERGTGAGEGFNLNFPLAKGTDWNTYKQALDAARDAITGFGLDVLLVSLGLDTFEDDPICELKIRTEDYLRMGEALAGFGTPVMFVFEGGYNIEKLGENTVNVLESFLGASR